MTCITSSTPIEIRTDDGVVLRPASQVCVGDILNADVPTRISHIFSQRIDAMWPIVSYMGIEADPAQWILLPSGVWERISNVGTASFLHCNSIYGFVVDGGKVIRAGGVTCCVHNYRDVQSWSSLPSSRTLASSPLSDESGDILG